MPWGNQSEKQSATKEASKQNEVVSNKGQVRTLETF